ncbi:MAG: DUF362 domain-containing protein [Bryobacteraceae bacterium]|nr:DUF362 domain-containing protein [Bryobacteraceae bacterium]
MPTRREWIAAAAGLAAAIPARSASAAPPVAIARCPDYGSALFPTLSRMMDQLGGLGALVRNKTVSVKLNLTGSPRERMGTTPAERAQYTHPAVIGSMVRLLSEAGARRVRLLECAFSCGEPLEEFLYDAGWDPLALLNAGARVEMENTNVTGRGRRYHRLMAPTPGYLYDGFDLNHAYDECDVMVSISKLKEHATCGITLGMKNMFGITPVTIYGDHAGKDEPAAEALSGRGAIFHSGRRQPSASAPQEKASSGPKDDKWRVPRIVVDICAARPLHLNVIDGIATMAGGEGPWNRGVRPVEPGLLIAGFGMVETDAAGTALMGFDPMAKRGQAPFENCDSTLELAEARGLGTRDLARMDIRGGRVEDLRFRFRA